MNLPDFDLSDGLIIAGVALIEIGTWQVYHPAAFIFGGLFCFAPFYFSHRAETQGRK